MFLRSKLNVVVALCLALLISATEGNAQETRSQQRTVKSFNLEGSRYQCPSAEEWEKGVKEIKQQVRSLLAEYLSDMQSQTTTSSVTISTVTQSPTEAGSTQSTESPTAGHITEENTESLTTGQTTEQNTELPTTGQATEQSTESPTTAMSITADPLTTTEQGMSTTLYTCNGTPGWRQVVFINMTDTSYNCPPGLNLWTYYSKRACGRAHNNRKACSSTTFSVGGSEYSQVCGRIRGYQVGGTSAFNGYLSYLQQINGQYVDGVSLTHGAAGRRQHIWTFAVGTSEVEGNFFLTMRCPCDTSNAGTVSPPFVGNDYFCESGLHSSWNCQIHCGMPFIDDPLWDGQNCRSTSTCCELNNPPWFTKTLPNPTTDNIELRICLSTDANNGDSPLEIVELYVK